MTQQQKDDLEAFARWQREELALEAELVARKARHAARAINLLLGCIQRDGRCIEHRTGAYATPIIERVRS